jgi:hypothetical protein
MGRVTIGSLVTVDRGSVRLRVLRLRAGYAHLELPDGSETRVPSSRCEVVPESQVSTGTRPMYYKSGWD